MFGAHEAQTRLTHWQRTLPTEVTVPGREQPVTRTALLAVIRAELLPFITFGPTYQRGVAEEFTRALDMFHRGWGEEFAYWLGQTLDVATRVRDVEPFEFDAKKVTATTWGVSYTTGSHVEGAVLNVHHFDRNVSGVDAVLLHPVYDGREFESREAAAEFAWNAGLTKAFISRHVAAQA
ncbi:hypothetical protein F3K32_42715 [Streptomyces sp. LBUM 1483]|uniref:hypothetical protein n=1 Tax=Streptomyces scabiei TaxID=1930 RepID=UPI001B31E3D3|nr:hypothetical protein [Streptomyces sp. LBUM 1483]MBP5926722.1 hypothetical protein [Streptomyces sp. LBUM 1483]